MATTDEKITPEEERMDKEYRGGRKMHQTRHPAKEVPNHRPAKTDEAATTQQPEQS